MSDQLERLVAEVPSELKRMVDADRRNNREVVEAALWREYGGHKKSALDRRIEEKERRLSMVESEKKEREREQEKLRQDIDALEEKKEEMVSGDEERLKRAAKKVGTTETKTLGTTIADGDQLKQVARNHDVDPAELREEVLNEDG